MDRYAWLELDGGMWHFLTDLYAHPGEATRQWPDPQSAFTELLDEGWSVVRPYPDRSSAHSGDVQKVYGYGLTRRIQ
jgi:hypothetical protein